MTPQIPPILDPNAQQQMARRFPQQQPMPPPMTPQPPQPMPQQPDRGQQFTRGSRSGAGTRASQLRGMGADALSKHGGGFGKLAAKLLSI